MDESRTNFEYAPRPQQPADETRHDFDFPQREAAFFYGLFLRGHSPEQLRRDISVPPEVLARWHRAAEHEAGARPAFERILEYRRSVLAIFESLLVTDSRESPVQ